MLVALAGTASLVVLGPSLSDVYCESIAVLNPSNTPCLPGVELNRVKYNFGRQALQFNVLGPQEYHGPVYVRGAFEDDRELDWGGHWHWGGYIPFDEDDLPLDVLIGSDEIGWTETTIVDPYD